MVKIGRTHLMDAVPIRLGQEFSGYARQIELAIERIEATLPGLRELAIGGTAVGTGLNTHPEFGARMARELSDLTGTEFREAENHFEAQGSRDAYVFTAGALTTLAAALMKIANDIRLLASGPQAGLGELMLPAIQPGSSIMPGKVNPVISEAVIQVGAQVTGNCQAITIGGQWGQLDLNVMLPMMAQEHAGERAAAGERLARLRRQGAGGSRGEPGAGRELHRRLDQHGHRAQPADRLRQCRQDRQEIARDRAHGARARL